MDPRNPSTKNILDKLETSTSHDKPIKIQLNEDRIKEIMNHPEADIPGVSIASFNINGPTDTKVIGVNHETSKPLKDDSIFRVASVSKTVFAYLVLRLIEDNKTGIAAAHGKFVKQPTELNEFNLDTPLYKAYPKLLDKFRDEDKERAKQITTRMVLSHTSGLPIKQQTEKLKLVFDPGTEYEYSNPGIALLQEVIEYLTDDHLQALAHKNIFSNEKFGMHHTTFLPPEFLNDSFSENEKHAQMIAANSLYTTPSDYARFISGWMRDDKLWQEATVSQTQHKRDGWAETQGVSTEDQAKVAWGLGLGLQLDEDGQVSKVFHSGDMNEWRAMMAIDKSKQEGIVYFSNSRNGFLLADEIITPHVNIDPALKSLFTIYGFARHLEEDFQTKEMDRISKIIAANEFDLSDLQSRGLITFVNDTEQHILTITCDPNYALLTRAIRNEFLNFPELKNPQLASYQESEDTLSISIKDNAQYNRFIQHLQSQKLLPKIMQPSEIKSERANQFKPS